jgi:hypothetical protein
MGKKLGSPLSLYFNKKNYHKFECSSISLSLGGNLLARHGREIILPETKKSDSP